MTIKRNRNFTFIFSTPVIIGDIKSVDSFLSFMQLNLGESNFRKFMKDHTHPGGELEMMIKVSGEITPEYPATLKDPAGGGDIEDLQCFFLPRE